MIGGGTGGFHIQLARAREQIGFGEEEAFGRIKGNAPVMQDFRVVDDFGKVFGLAESLLFQNIGHGPPWQAFAQGKLIQHGLAGNQHVQHLLGRPAGVQQETSGL